MNALPIIPRQLIRNGWSLRHLLFGLALAVLSVMATIDAWRDILHIALRDEESSHAFLVPIVVAWLLWVRRRRLRHCRRAGLWIGPLIGIAGAVLYAVGDTNLIQSFWHGGAVLLLIGSILTVLGTDVLRAFLPVFIAMVFIIPVPGRIRQRVAIPLQTATAGTTKFIFDLADIPVVQSGNLLSINGVDVAISEACNGLRMIFALAMVSYAFAFGTPLKGYVRLLVLVATPISAIFCNVVRLIPTVWVYGSFSAEVSQVVHDVSGWVMLGVSFALLLGLLRLLRWAMIPVTPFTLAYD